MQSHPLCLNLLKLLTYGWLSLPKAKPPKLAEQECTHKPDFTVKVVTENSKKLDITIIYTITICLLHCTWEYTKITE